jgi:hypothetical protein
VFLVTNVTTAWIALVLVVMTESVMEMATTLVTTVTQPLVAVMIAPVQIVGLVMSLGATEIALSLVIVALNLGIVAHSPETVMVGTMMIMLPSFSASFREKTRL